MAEAQKADFTAALMYRIRPRGASPGLPSPRFVSESP